MGTCTHASSRGSDVSTSKHVAVAMSGGVDSSVVATLLLERGYSVVGLTMRLWREPALTGEETDEAAEARAVCAHLGIPHHVIDLREAFLREVVDYFVREYAQGRTPNPCLRCNAMLKFGRLLEHGRELGYDYLATGHYARIAQSDDGYRLLCGLDARKDQSYVLYALQQRQLGTLLLPLGDYTKTEVRALAQARRLPTAERPESQDICFLRDRDYRRFLAERLPVALQPGPILDRQGHRLGEHKGLPYYTIGQREGLGIAAPRPLYVLGLDVPRNALIVGGAEELGQRALIAERMSYVSGVELPAGCSVEAKIRYRAPRAAARVWALSGSCSRVVFERPLRDITPGQAVVLYQGDQVLGGGIIAQATEPES
jgi:tRNA-uridine 2-sulfurtransferase